MAEQLGSAVLTVSVDDRQLKAGLQAAERQAKATGQSIEQAFTKSGKPIQTAANGLQYFVDAQGKARDIAGKFLTIAQQQEAGLAGIGAAAAGAGRGLGGFGGAVGGIGATAAGAAVSVAAIGAAVIGIGAASVQSAGQIQRLNAAFVGLTGSAEAAKQLRQDLFTLSKTTPFKNEEILQAAQRFLAVGVEVDKLQGTINRVGAIAAQSGQPLERLALIYAQVYAKGRLQGEENLQLLEAGVDLTQELSAVTGKSGTALQDAMSKGQISINDFNKALLLATGEMSALQLAGRAVDVQFNNVFDNLGQLFGGFAQAIAPALSASFKVINDIFDSAFPSLESITKFFEPLTQAAERFSKTLEGNPQLIAAIASGFKSIGSIVVENIAIGLETVSSILSKIDGKQLIKGLIQVELLLRKALLASRALSATILKNAELTFRGITNPVQFGKDIFAAGGFKAFIEKEYGQVYQYWTAAAQAKPLPFPDVQSRPEQQTKGDLSTKPDPGAEQAKLAAAQLQRVESEISLNTLKRQIAAAHELAKVEAGVVRETIRQRQEIEAGVQASRERVRLIGAQIEALRLQGKDSGPELDKLVSEQVVASEEVRLKLIEGATALKDAGKQLRQDLKEAELQLAKVRSDSQGLNKFLTPDQQERRDQQTLRSLLPQFREAQFKFSRLTGQRAPEFTGTTSNVNQSVIDFIERVKQEEIATQNVASIQEALNKNTMDLVAVNGQLAGVMRELSAKNWNVNVNVPSGTANGDVVGAVNGAF